MVPVNRANTPSTVARSGAGPSLGVISPSRSSVDDEAPKQIVARYALRSARWNSTTRVARPRNTGSTPDANGSSVPPWPTRLVAASRRTRLTMSWDVGPIGLSTTRIPSRPGPSEERATSASDGRGGLAGLGQHGVPCLIDGEWHRRAGSPCMPSPTEQSRQDGRVDTAGSCSDADPRGIARLLEQDRDLSSFGLGEQVDDP